MKKLSLVLLALALFASSPARADWSSDLQTAITSGNYSEINVIAANNPNAQGGIAIALLQAASSDIAAHPDAAIKLFTLAVPFTDQIALGQALGASNNVSAMLALASEPAFQKKDPHGAGEIFTAALAISSEGNIAVVRPGLHNTAVAEADDFAGKYADNDKDLQKQINLALQIGTPPPVGPHGVLTPSPE